MHNKFSTDLIPGEICYLEYYEPKNEKGKGIIEISKVIYGYIDILNYQETEILKKSMNEEILLSGSCNRNVNCPEGDEFCREKYSVSRIIVGGHLCTGSLINNVRQDYTPYYLTANHCLVGDTDVWLFQFGYMYESCNGGWPLPTYSFSGADIRANWANSDFALLELQEQPQSGENNFQDVFFNGWDRTENIPDNLIALHHPNGDYMKINTDDDDLTIWSNHWLVRNWNTGTTEPGSSGSSLYNQDQRVIGQLHGQLPLNIDPFHEPCDPEKESIYGMISRSWLGGGTSATSLSPWLDPDNTGVETLDGIKMPLLKYGWIITNGQSFQRNAYSQMRIGSSNISQFTVQNGGNLTLKAGKEIVIRPCTAILSGSVFRAHIEELDCSELVMLSDKESDYDASICSSQNPPMAKQVSNTKYNFYSQTNIKIQPNPFSEDTRISISLSNSDIITLTIYDILGNQIATLADGESLSAGNHNFSFSGQNINSGVYYVVMSSSTERISRPLMLIK